MPESAKVKYPKIHGYELTQQIGGGGFSTVYRATNYETSEVAACKVISITSDMTPTERKVLNKEMHVHSIMKHPNVLEFYKAMVVEENNREGYFPAFYMLLELAAGGDLFDKIAPEIGVEPDIAQHYFKQLAAGLEYIHSVGVCHRDLKPENILLDAAGRLKISDFGLCAVYKLEEGGKMKTRLLSENCGSKPYVAPEVILGSGKPYEAEPIDVWGIGVILFTMLSGNTPWDEPSGASPEYLSYISGDCFHYEPWNTFDRDVLELITGMLTPEPAMRMTLRDVIHHPWMMRENLLTQQGPAHVAEALTASLRREGDLDIATPNLAMVTRIDRDGDQIMLTAVPHSQFTQTLMLFSQTQVGRRYTPVLTRFYTSILPGLLLPLIESALTAQKIKYKELEPKRDGDTTRLRLRIGGFDKRKLVFKGTIELEEFEHDDFHGTFCVMNREKGNPISWRQTWKSLIVSPEVEPHVLRKR